MTHSLTIRPVKFSILGIIAGVVAIPMAVLWALFLVQSLIYRF